MVMVGHAKGKEEGRERGADDREREKRMECRGLRDREGRKGCRWPKERERRGVKKGV